ncbi:cadherin-12 isoform X1 [Lagopus muta]|uniref:cadherin-12 isoform X1 n=1 Tax=Lagopus muta TaxID=64668 RepID=UPI00209E2951|nr:cadherin-12 isoform X1 [Lagopus muta]XP_048795359.1 cadherin-12 isoform X1 [Lagopus muta]XP_048795360.1 cadherin-12 isoform X1 [Lagopus muta]XP_048795361.1 cadherin-12 isoform X1 [Lagopus muta]XP_048795362.1 cadherin-12 isoform X1 [Lagopus muta]XP_048795363.1 cadherin-12 isoform X1 [Lagopus muta]XP_048795364.1 cadherin-12 isoform X1 [Lagopus muta]XP_048795365.1 cadherin-12 isoform X1 [Lagopus muta]XP_048795366.1 cadherin-12 isoform X1 [Lagopus muta]
MLTRNCLSLLLWVLFDGGLLTPLHPQPQQTLEAEPRENVVPVPGRRSSAQRVKRGWVWNQFFVLEEYMGSEPQYVGKLHSDLDKGVGTVKYTLSGDGAGTVFTIDETTGDIHAIRSLDREEKPFYTLRAQAVDVDTKKPLEPESEFIIKVQDINDNEPKFLDGPYIASVPEMSPVGAYVLQVKATDADDPTYGNSARVVYSILQGQPYFSIDPKTGVIRTALPNMDREVKEQYQVLIQAKDMGGQLGGLAGTTTVNITLTDVNDNPPRFPKSIFHLKVPESSHVGSAIGRIRAVDPDFGENAEIEYNIVPGDGGNLFDITTDENTQEGVIKLKKPLDFETKKAYTFKVEASNLHLDHRFHSVGPFKDTATVKINVLDMDEPPVFSKPLYTMEVYEDTPVGTIIGAVTAQDLDAGSSSIRYFIDWKNDVDNYFTIDANEGTIATNELLDRESTAQYNFSIIASKVSNPLLTSKVNVIINVLDVNEFPPEISVPYETSVCENAKPGQVIQTVTATDKDLSPAGQRFSFRLSPEASNKPNFTVHDYRNNTAGIETRRNGYSRRQQELYFLPVVIEDSSYPVQSSTNTMTIRVCRCDSDGTILSCNVEAIFLPVGLSTGALIAILLCIVILLVIVVLYVALRRQKKKDTLMTSKEDIRDNVIHYDDEGGGEEDTQAFDIGALRNPKVIEDNKMRRDIKPDTLRFPRQRPPVEDNTDIRDFINQRLQENDVDPTAPPYDSLATYAYEGNGSVAESLSSIESLTTEADQDYDYLSDWGPRFKILADMFGEEESYNPDKVT